eukprot:gene11025-3095_t
MSSVFGSGSGSSLWQWGAAIDDEEDYYNKDSSGSFNDPESQVYKGGKDCVVFAIDCSPPMFDDMGSISSEGDHISEQSYVLTAIKAVHSALRNKIICSDKDLVGIVLFSTENRKNETDPEHVYVLQDLDVPSAEQIQQLQELCSETSELLTICGTSDVYALNDALWVCGNLFSNVRSKVETKRILLFTNVDSPYSAQDDLRRQLETKTRDFADLNVELALMHMSGEGRRFNLDAFYRQIVSNSDDEPDSPVASGFESLLARVRYKAQRKRARMTIPWKITRDSSIGIKVYNLVGTSTKASYVWLDADNNEEIVSKTRYYCAETATPLLSTDLKYCFKYGGEKVVFTKSEVDYMSSFGDPGLLLLGFKPRSRELTDHNVKKCSFVYPDETIVSGSTRAFAALLDRCLKLDHVPICRLIARKNACPEFVALLPQEERVDDDGNQVIPPGFHVIVLPFADDIREIKKNSLPEPSEEQVRAMKKLITSMNFSAFSSERFENPTLQKHYAVIEALALNMDAEDDFNDHTS